MHIAMKILFLSRWFPYPTNNGSKLRIYNLLKGMAPEHEITLLTFADEPGAGAAAPELDALCRRILVVPWRPFNPGSWRARLGFLSFTPRSVVDTYSLEMRQHIERELATGQYDLIVASQWLMASYQPYFGAVPALFEEVEVGLHYQQYEEARALPERLRLGMSWAKHRFYIARLLKRFQASTVVSGEEKWLLGQIAPKDSTV